jgi:Component of IIS longevity pathway SMK-1
MGPFIALYMRTFGRYVTAVHKALSRWRRGGWLPEPHQTCRAAEPERLASPPRQVVPITDEAVRAKIHQTYRIGYLKDVILPRVLDDGAFATLSSLMHFNIVEVLTSLQADPRFLPELFARLRSDKSSTDEALVSFLQVGSGR